ncbi:Saccharopine dehydrogenase / Homospermidine synthase [Pleurostoma richardsiae]|uniref:Saccharopine dehydrogenase / Homospermidine synthase n=1 Tax=Pleurostoma richardsiae TaxID=41990 RepID=A0AA38S0E4_9PEZI|nr:Saccharopine dehydrogenase / Homospermidine synthase [Pleurostoma richardsiae]
MESDSGVSVTVACRTLTEAQALLGNVKNAHPISLDVPNQQALDAEVAKHDIVISLIPYTSHATVIKSAIRQKRHVVTTSYVSPAMLELDQLAKGAGITVMNEIGLDPGIDHLYVIKIIEEVHKDSGKTDSFLSYCGGLPAPEDSDNPLGYKSPDLPVERYSIPEGQTILRGTLRYQGFPEFIHEATTDIAGAASASEADLRDAILAKATFDSEGKKRIISGLRWVRIFSDENITPAGNPLDTLCATLKKKMQFEGEHDLVMLQHKFEIENKDGSRKTRTSSLCEYGELKCYFAMAKLVVKVVLGLFTPSSSSNTVNL